MMKRKLQIRIAALLVVIITIGNSLFAQTGWQEVYSTDGTEAFMRDICFVPGTDGTWSTGWAVAYEGDIVKTEDGGDTWTEIEQNLSSQLAGISFSDQDTGYICTLDNKILKSIDGGATWSTIYNGTVNFDKIAFKDGLTGVASGTEKIYTTDGGATWTTGTGGSAYWDLDHAGGDTYYGVNLGGDLGKSGDGGATWTNVESLPVFAFMTDWLDEQSGMYGGDLSTIEVTSDGGSSWINNTLGGGQDAINCGGFYDADTIYACGSSGEVFKSINAGVSWTTDTSFSAGVFQPRGLVVTGANVIFAAANATGGDGKVWRKIGAPPINADFSADPTVVCAGSTVNYTDMSYGVIDSWTWTFEGGSPATSTDQNPSITYNATGFFDVKLVVTVGSFIDSLTMVDYIEVVEMPAQANTPDGDEVVCTDNVYAYATDVVGFGHEYEWELSPTSAGSLIWQDTAASLTVANDWTGDFTIRVRASNVCGDGDWSDYLEGTVYQSPEVFTVEGGGGYCLNGEGVEITLSGSETGIDYELYLDGAQTGNIVAGTGSEISFGLVTDEGDYEVFASNTNCLQLMDEQVNVFLLFPPIEPVDPTGPVMVCSNETSDYESTGTPDADSYEWVLSPEDAGTITGNGLEATVSWSSEFSGTANVSLYGLNDCGDGNSSNPLAVEVEAVPAPVVNGPDEVCDETSENYSVTENETSIFTWEVSGGTISDGQGTNLITIDWGLAGNGTITVTEESSNNCVGTSETFEVFIDDCTGINEFGNDIVFSIYPNPANDLINVFVNSPIGDDFTIKVYNNIGQLMSSKKISLNAANQVHQVDVSALNSGLFLLVIESDSKVHYKTSVIKR